MSSDLYYQTEDLPKTDLPSADPTVKEELEALKEQVARLATALQDATDRANRLERQVEAQKERISALEPVAATTSEERQRIEALERYNIDRGLHQFYHCGGWKTPAFVPKAHVLGIFNKK